MATYRKPFEHRLGQGAQGKRHEYVEAKYLFGLMKKHHNLPHKNAEDCLLALKDPLLFEKFLDKVEKQEIGIFMGKVGGKCIARYVENGGDNAGEIINRLGGIAIGDFIRTTAFHNPEKGPVEAGIFVGKGDIEKVVGFFKEFGGGSTALFIFIAGGGNMAGFLDEVGVERALKYARKEKIDGAREIRDNFAKAVERAKALKAG